MKKYQDIKMAHGGKREGCGRKPGSINRITAVKQASKQVKDIKGAAAKKAVTAAGILGLIDESEKWLSLLEATTKVRIGTGDCYKDIEVPDKRIQLDAMKFLTEQRDGRAKQKIDQTIDDKRKKEASAERVSRLLHRAIARLGEEPGQASNDG